jgi:hypothetical protein
MSIENVTTALQVNATTGEGFSLFLSEPRFVAFRIVGNSLWHFPRADQHARNRRNRNGPGHSA